LSKSQLRSDYKGAPAPLATLFSEQNELLSGGASAFERELRALRGYPVVVNQWASWCDNCREESAIFQEVAPLFAHKVAFLGDDVNDHGGASWLKKFPLSFPSYSDPDTSIARVLGPLSDVAPVTYFYNRQGKEVYPHAGPYLSKASLEHDLRLYLGALDPRRSAEWSADDHCAASLGTSDRAGGAAPRHVRRGSLRRR
jgi:thiol-disulfide isomerase/thioredoxin